MNARRKHPLGRGRAVGVRLPQGPRSQSGSQTSRPRLHRIKRLRCFGGRYKRNERLDGSAGTSDRDLPNRRHRSAAASVWSAAANHGLMPTIRPLRTARCSANKAQLTGLHPHAGGFVPGPVKSAGLHSGFSWSHLWSHSCKFSGVRSGLPSLGSDATEPNPTCLNHQPQNSKAREGQPSAGSNPAATASLTRGTPAPAKPARRL
jgi:hypothetical protein